MKKILFTLFLFINVSNIYSQNNYYTSTKVINGDGYSYKCDLDNYGFVTLYNTKNKYTYTEWARKDGKPISDDILLGYTATIYNSTPGIKKALEHISKHFTSEEVNQLKDSKLLVTLIIDTFTTGKLQEVNFVFLANSPLCSVPVSKYRAIELDLLHYLGYVFAKTSEGLALNYCIVSFDYQF